MEAFFLRTSAVVALGIAALLSGCATPYGGNCTTQTAVTTGEVKGGGKYRLQPTGEAQFTMYPGQTAVLPVQVVAEDGGTGTVTIAATGLPSGVTMNPVTATIGTTANLSFTSTAAMGSECFLGQTQIYSAYSTVDLQAAGAAGNKSLGMDLDMLLENPSFAPATTTLPVMKIATTGAVGVTSKDDYVTASMTLTDTTTKSNNYTGTLQIKGHGNTTWIMPKKPYRIKLDSKSKLLGMPSEKNWILLANYDDKTMLRDALASELSNRVGLPWAPRSQFVELSLDGAYQGTYQLIENIDINSNRINIADSDTSETDQTQNGFLLEIDQREGDTFHWMTPHGIDIGSDDPDPPTDAGEAYVQTSLDEAEATFYSPVASSTSTAGWRKSWNESSVVDWFLVNELMGNQDAAAFSSDYLYKDAGASAWVMGPIWDFDVSTGNNNYDSIQDPTVPWIRTHHPWYAELFRNDPTFQTEVKARWTAVRPQITTLPAFVDAEAATLNQAAGNNYSRWPTLYQRVWPNVVAEGSYAGEVTYLKGWLAQRVAYMDSVYLNQ